MTSIIFELGRELVNEVQAGIKAHQDIKEGKEVERRQDKWGDPLAPKTVYSVVRGVEETLGMGKSNNDKGRVKEPNKEAISERELASSLLPMRVAETAATDGDLNCRQDDQPLNRVLPLQPPVTKPFAALNLEEKSHSDTTPNVDSPDSPVASPAHDEEEGDENLNESQSSNTQSVSRSDDHNRIQLDGIGSPIQRESTLPAHLRPPPPPPPTQADKIQKGLETADNVAAEIALGVFIGGALDGPTHTLVEGLMALDDEETPQSKKNREALKKARKEIDKQTPKFEGLTKKLATYQEGLDKPPGSRSGETVEKDRKRLKEKMESVQKDLRKVEGKLEKAEWDVGKYKPRVEEHERLIREKRLEKVSEKREREKKKAEKGT